LEPRHMVWRDMARNLTERDVRSEREIQRWPTEIPTRRGPQRARWVVRWPDASVEAPRRSSPRDGRA
jgi:hypothetical protein